MCAAHGSNSEDQELENVLVSGESTMPPRTQTECFLQRQQGKSHSMCWDILGNIRWDSCRVDACGLETARGT
jgi:hypothetical protein